MNGSSHSKLAPLTFWVVALSVAIAVMGSSTLLFPGPDIGEGPASPSGRDIVARVVAPVFGPAPARERDRTGSEAPSAAAAPVAVAPAPLVAIPASKSAERPARVGRRATVRPRGDTGQPSAREDATKGGAKAKTVERKSKAGKSPSSAHTVAGAKSQGHGHLKSTPPRGPKQPHVQPAKGHGKAKGHARAHARAGR
jgi:hypothetical protein